jgi:hypothetical protein
MANAAAHNPIDGRAERIREAIDVIRVLTTVRERVAPGALHEHIEWAKEAVWAAAYPGADGSLLDALTAEADNAR